MKHEVMGTRHVYITGDNRIMNIFNVITIAVRL